MCHGPQQAHAYGRAAPWVYVAVNRGDIHTRLRARRVAVRAAYDGRCGYCTVHESEAGTELEIDYFQPRSAGGSDHPDNLVYCCTACNRLKGDFWPADRHPSPAPPQA